MNPIYWIIFFFQVEAMMTDTDQFLGRRVPPHLFEYAHKNETNWFWYKETFVPKKTQEERRSWRRGGKGVHQELGVSN